MVFDDLPRMYSTEETLLNAEGIIDKVTWLAINMKIVETITFDTASGSPSKPRSEDPRIKSTYMSAYVALLNFWFGWDHLDFNGHPKSKISSSFRDPIALLKIGTCLYLATRTDPTTLASPPKMVPADVLKRIDNVFMRAHEINHSMVRIISLFSSHPERTPLMSSDKYDTAVRMIARRDAIAKTFAEQLTIMDKIQKREKRHEEFMEAKKGSETVKAAKKREEPKMLEIRKNLDRAVNEYETFISGGFVDVGPTKDAFETFADNHGPQAVYDNIASIFAHLGLALTFVGFIRNELKKKDGAAVTAMLTSNDNTITNLVLKWVNQNTIWAWGGIMEKFDREVILNSPDGIKSLDFDSIFLHASRAVVGPPTSGDKQFKMLQLQKMKIAWTPNSESMHSWLKEMWPEAFSDGGMPRSLLLPTGDVQLSNSPAFMGRLVSVPGGVQSYAAALRSAEHPAFGAAFISAMYEEVGVGNGETAAEFMRDTRGMVHRAWSELDTQKTFFVCVPHGACTRPCPIYPNAITEMEGTCTTGPKAAAKAKIIYATDLFSYDDDLAIPPSTATLQMNIVDLQKKLAKRKKGGPAKDDGCRAQLAECTKALAAAEAEKTKRGQAAASAAQAASDCNAALAKETAAKASEIEKYATLLATHEKTSAMFKAAMERNEKHVKQEEDLTEALRKSGGQTNDAAKAARAATAAARADTADCMKKLDDLRKLLDQLGVSDTASFNAAKAALDGAPAAVQKLATAEAALASQKSAATAAIDTIAAELNAEKARAAALKRSLDAAGDCTGLLTAEQAKTARLEKSVADAQKAKIETDKEIVDLKTANDEAEAEKQKAKGDLTTAQGQITKLSADFTALQAAAPGSSAAAQATFDGKLAAEKALMVTQHAQELAALNAKYKKEADDFKKKTDSEYADIEFALDDAIKAGDAMKAKMEEAERKAAASAALAASADSDKTDLEEIKDDLEKQVEELKKQLKTEQDDKAAKVAEIAAQQPLLEEANRKTAALMVAIAEKEEMIKTKSKELADKVLELDDSEAAREALTKKVADLNTEIAGLTASSSSSSTMDAASRAKLALADGEIVSLKANVLALETENAALKLRIKALEQELAQLLSGSTALPPIVPLGTPSTIPGLSTSMPAARVNMVDTPPGTPLKTTEDKVEALALGTACGDPGKKAEGCINTAATNVPCDVPDQVMRAVCDYSTIPVPLDLHNVSLTYSVLDPGSKVRLQLLEALSHFKVGRSLMVGGSGVVLDRSLIPIRKMYDYTEINGAALASPLSASNIQYARFLDAASGKACRQVFDTIYGSNVSSLPVDKLASIGLEIVVGPGIFYKVIAGPFGQVFRKNAGDIVTPAQLLVHQAFNTGVGVVYPLNGDNYMVTTATPDPDAVLDGKAHMVAAVRHLANAAATYIYETAYDEKTVMIPGTTKIPAGAFAMLPRADISAVLAATVLYPRSLTNSKTPAFPDIISQYEKDDEDGGNGSLGSHICAVGCEVLENYARESILGVNELTFDAKTNPLNSGAVMAEAAKRVAEITKLAEAFQ